MNGDYPPDPPPQPVRHGLKGRSTSDEALCYCGRVFTGPNFKTARDTLNRHASLAKRMARINSRRKAP